MPVGVGGPFAALMIHEVTDPVDLTAVADRRAQHVMRLQQIGDKKTARSPKLERGLLQNNFPMHTCLRRFDDLLQTKPIEVSRVPFEPRGEAPIMRRLRKD